MVERVEKKFNKGICKINATPLFWMRELKTSSWECHKCRERKKPGAVTFEVTVRFAAKTITNGQVQWVEKPIKHYLCLTCAERLLTEALEKVGLVNTHGVDAFKLFEEL